jgi:hypothetical protein
MTKKIIARSIVGGQWVARPGGIIDYTVHITKPADPIVKGSPISPTAPSGITCPSRATFSASWACG